MVYLTTERGVWGVKLDVHWRGVEGFVRLSDILSAHKTFIAEQNLTDVCLTDEWHANTCKKPLELHRDNLGSEIEYISFSGTFFGFA
jgi:hypothetical protein